MTIDECVNIMQSFYELSPWHILQVVCVRLTSTTALTTRVNMTAPVMITRTDLPVDVYLDMPANCVPKLFLMLTTLPTRPPSLKSPLRTVGTTRQVMCNYALLQLTRNMLIERVSKQRLLKPSPFHETFVPVFSDKDIVQKVCG